MQLKSKMMEAKVASNLLINGVYILKITRNGEVYTRKISK